jgi:hypothetical protein
MPILLAGTVEFVHTEQVSALDKFYCIFIQFVVRFVMLIKMMTSSEIIYSDVCIYIS